MKATQFYGNGNNGRSHYERVLITPYKKTDDSGSETDSDFETPKTPKEKKGKIMEIDLSDNDDQQVEEHKETQQQRTKIWSNSIPSTTNKFFRSKTPQSKKESSQSPDNYKNKKTHENESSVSSIKSSTSKMSRMGLPRRAGSPSRMSSNTSRLSSRDRGVSIAALARQNPGQNNNMEKNSSGYRPLPIFRSKISPPATSPSKDSDSQQDSVSEFYKSAMQSAEHSPSSSLRSRGDKSSLIHDRSLISNVRNRRKNSSSISNDDSHDDSRKSPGRLFSAKSKTVAAGSNMSKDSSSNEDDKSFFKLYSQNSSTSSSNRKLTNGNNDSQRRQQHRHREEEENDVSVKVSNSPVSLKKVKLEEKDNGGDNMLISEDDSVRQEIVQIALRCQRNKTENLENLTFENLFQHFLKKFNNIREGPSSDKLPAESLGILAEFMKKDETFFNVMEELEKIRGDANLLENKSIDELFDLVMNNMQDFVQEEFAKAYRGWNGVTFFFSI